MEKEVEVEHFTVSAHSFIAKKSLDLGFHGSSLYLIGLSTNLACAAFHHGILPFLFVQQYLFVRVAIVIMHIIWKFFGHSLKLHSVVKSLSILAEILAGRNQNQNGDYNLRFYFHLYHPDPRNDYNLRHRRSHSY